MIVNLEPTSKYKSHTIIPLNNKILTTIKSRLLLKVLELKQTYFTI